MTALKPRPFCGGKAELADFVSNYCPYNCGTIVNLVARSLMRGNKVVINADW